ncbi:acyl-CoA dehydrogenase family protein [Lysinibacillus agricola]|uniref:Acyl-CoA dehydrogenase family protein n=1 Tax=Lysinibacillus agricola TaxID=2590012 RepID=A0ABX7AKI4_9BACI|nr:MULTISPECIES: acyl-CoA dehydrogenase family protein [Lysinibacillus]KOS60492.1 acyl-CoA dehydrogenase [Lysinibacillus sp. FJAT-14222]QQP10287.1 acyl-CoA dehydrogenase family protein [Lysinibacillus agricola]
MDKIEDQMTTEERMANLFSPEDFHDEELLIGKTAEMFIKQEVSPNIPSIEQHQHEVTRKLFQRAGNLGLLAIEVPEAYGGLELTKKISGLVAEKMGFGGSFSVSYNIHVGVGTLPYVYFGDEQQKQEYLPKLTSGEWIGAYALTESDAGSDALHPKTNAVLNEDGSAWVLNGEKQWITNARLADVFVVFAKTNEGMTAFIVERTFQGVSVGPEEEKMGIKGSSTATLILEDVEVPKKNILGDVGKGHKVAMNILNMARLKLAFSNIGTSKQALQLAVNYGKERKQFNTSLVNFTMIQEKLANMAIAIYGAESAAYRTAGEMDDAIDSADKVMLVNKISDFAMECALNKVNCSEMLGKIVDEAVQIHGGYGYMQDYEVERLYRDARISRIFEGTNEINRLTISKILLNRYAKAATSNNASTADQPLERNHQYIQLSKYLLQIALTAISNAHINIEHEQEYMRLLADMVKVIYVMESSLLRTEKAGNEKIKRLMTDILCEEGYRRMEEFVVEIISATETTEQKRRLWLDEIRHLSIPIYQNLFMLKREIAKNIIDNPKSII